MPTDLTKNITGETSTTPADRNKRHDAVVKAMLKVAAAAAEERRLIREQQDKIKRRS